jgi:hypothetical protein
MNKNPAAIALGSQGGKKTKEKYGVEHFREAGKRSGEARRNKAKTTT